MCPQITLTFPEQLGGSVQVSHAFCAWKLMLSKPLLPGHEPPKKIMVRGAGLGHSILNCNEYSLIPLHLQLVRTLQL